MYVFCRFPFMLQMIWVCLSLDLWIGYVGSIRIHLSVTQVLERERWIDIVSANICNYNRRCISSFICVRFTRDLEADRWEWSDPFCNQTASICFPYKHPHTPKWYQKIPSEMEPPLHYKLLDCLHCIHSCMQGFLVQLLHILLCGWSPSKIGLCELYAVTRMGWDRRTDRSYPFDCYNF